MLGGRLSVLQAALYIVLAATLALVLLDRTQLYFAIAERAAVDVTLNNARSALGLRLAYERMQGTLSRERQWDGGNPFALAWMKVDNYVGEVDGIGGRSSMPRGVWAFDSRAGELLYRPAHPRGLIIPDRAEVLRFRLSVPDAGAVPNLHPVVEYAWNP